MNFVEATIVRQGEGLAADCGAFRLTLPPEKEEFALPYVGKKVTFGIRPEDLYDSKIPLQISATSGNTLQADVDVTEPLGSDVEIYLKAGEVELHAMIDSSTDAKVGDRLEIVVDMKKSHLFDNDTERAIY